MKAITISILILCLGASVVTAGDSGSARDITEAEIAVTMDLIMRARPQAALDHVDSLADTCGDDLLYLLTRARVLQEFVPVDDDRKDYTKQQAEPVIDLLDEVIERSTQRMESGDEDPKLLLYRGWAWMAKSHMRALCRSFYTAGRDAGRGKGYLEDYLEYYPDDPIANGLLGAFLYFTDAVPAVLQFLSKLLFLPGGDRERGLEMIERSIATESVFEIDFQQVAANVYFFFEGRHEEGLERFAEIMDRYPAYPRPAIAVAAGRVLAPQHQHGYDARVDQLLDHTASIPSQEVDGYSVNTVRALRAYADCIVRSPEIATHRLQTMIDDSPEHPDWALDFARFQLGQQRAVAGYLREARRLFELVLEDDASDRFHDGARRMLDDIDEFDGAIPVSTSDIPGDWIEAIYTTGGDSLAAIERRLADPATTSPRAVFYLGECRLMRNDLERALAAYRRLLDWELPAWFDDYRVFSANRIAEIHALSGDFEAAHSYQEQALDHYNNLYRMDWILEGRARYFKRLDEGASFPPPTLLSVSRDR